MYLGLRRLFLLLVLVFFNLLQIDKNILGGDGGYVSLIFLYSIIINLFCRLAKPFCLTVLLSSCLSAQNKHYFFVILMGTLCLRCYSHGNDIRLPPLHSPPLPATKSSTLSLTDVHHIYIHGVWEGAAQCVGGHHRDVVVDPDGRVVLVEEAGVLSGRVVVRTLVHGIRAVGEGREHSADSRVSLNTQQQSR